MGPLYARWFGVEIDAQPLRVESHGLQLELAHGHLFKEKPKWKSWMEGRVFLESFARLPEPCARALERLLDATNERTRAAAELRMIAAYRARAQSMPDPPDLLIYGHVHRVADEPGPPRLVVLGDWIEGTRYLRIEQTGALHVDEGL
jgi:UDP-2,3-diacylglucosamine pyrophosphatase LpxH